jgi:hypothetical protein
MKKVRRKRGKMNIWMAMSTSMGVFALVVAWASGTKKMVTSRCMRAMNLKAEPCRL